MRLKRHEQPSRAEALEGLKRRLNLRRMMTVVVEDTEARVAKKFLLTPRRAGETRDGVGDRVRRVAEPMEQRDDGAGVGDILLADKPQREVAELLAGMPDFKTTRSRRDDQSIVRQRMETVGDRSGPAGEELRQTRIVGAEDQRVVRLLREVRELAADGVEVRVEVEMLGIDIQHDGVLRPELGQRAVAFVGFGDEEILGSNRQARVTR